MGITLDDLIEAVECGEHAVAMMVCGMGKSEITCLIRDLDCRLEGLRRIPDALRTEELRTEMRRIATLLRFLRTLEIGMIRAMAPVRKKTESEQGQGLGR